ncbi:MAG TPA: OmpH family outer membrane protein, partial [Niabella sp.]|nr:OmpH family outer membrane protein [Niabella sp.]
MKRFKILALLMGAVVAGSFSANAQKIGTVDVQGLVSALPEVQQVQADLEKYQKDSVGARFEQLSKEYAEKDSTYKNPKTVKSVKDLLEKDLADLSMTLNNWQQIGTQAIQSKQQQLLAPL